MKEAKYPKISHLIDDLLNEINNINQVEEKINLINFVRKKIHEISPLKYHPVDYVFWEKSEKVEGNEYNPNNVAPPEMKLLVRSISEDGYTMPIVAYSEDGKIRIVDGYHRRKAADISSEIRKSTLGYLPLTEIRKDRNDISHRMASTIRHNRARGTHDIELMSNIVAELVQAGMSDVWIIKNIGMDADELLRLKQITGLAALFKDQDFSTSSEIYD